MPGKAAHLEAIDIADRRQQTVTRLACGGLFVFIGADADTAWLSEPPLTMPTYAKTLIACAALAALWFALQFPINMVILLIAATREEGQWWITLMKNAFSPALSAYFALAIVERFHRSVSWKAVTAFFVCALIAYTIWSIGYNAEHYLLSNRISEWRSVLWETILSSVSAIVVATVLYVQRTRGANPAIERPLK